MLSQNPAWRCTPNFDFTETRLIAQAPDHSRKLGQQPTVLGDAGGFPLSGCNAMRYRIVHDEDPNSFGLGCEVRHCASAPHAGSRRLHGAHS
jgi:hypothetical protein